jgi:uncharacterized membrane protein
MLENQEFKDTEHISGSSKPPLHSNDFKPSDPEKKSWWSLQSIFMKLAIVVLGIVALFIVTEVLEQIDRMLYQLYKIGIWVFAVYVVILIIRSLFKKH